MAQVHHRTSTTHTTIYFGSKEVARCCRVPAGPAGDQYSVSLSAPKGAKHFYRADLRSVKATYGLPGRIQVVLAEEGIRGRLYPRPLTPV